MICCAQRELPRCGGDSASCTHAGPFRALHLLRLVLAERAQSLSGSPFWLSLAAGSDETGGGRRSAIDLQLENTPSRDRPMPVPIKGASGPLYTMAVKDITAETTSAAVRTMPMPRRSSADAFNATIGLATCAINGFPLANAEYKAFASRCDASRCPGGTCVIEVQENQRIGDIYLANLLQHCVSSNAFDMRALHL
jgi:hypothetical protein